jgi:hypothetical protein|tara:strand:- start:2546 stop:2851 length:306 start_codon:yes stop_codon:yes gene_type:complete
MNDDEKIRLAEYIADLVVSRLNSQFDFNVAAQQEIDNDIDIYVEDLLSGRTKISEELEEHLIAELARLTTLLSIYEDKEQYEKANIIKNKIRIINKRLDNL